MIILLVKLLTKLIKKAMSNDDLEQCLVQTFIG